MLHPTIFAPHSHLSHHVVLILAGCVLLLAPSGKIVSSPGTERSDIACIGSHLEELRSADREDARISATKRIHDAIVSADLSQRTTVRRLDQIIPDIETVMSEGLDRVNIGGQEGWLASALGFYAERRLEPTRAMSASDWTTDPTHSEGGTFLTVFPDRILLNEPDGTRPLFEGNGIHEAVISPAGRHVAFFTRTNNAQNEAHIWVISVRTGKAKPIHTTASCKTLFFSDNGRHLFFEERTTDDGTGQVVRISRAGRGKRVIAKGAQMESVVVRGPHRGTVIVRKSSRHPLGFANHTALFAISANGRTIWRIVTEN